MTNQQLSRLAFCGLVMIAACDRGGDSAAAGIGKLATGGVAQNGEGSAKLPGPAVVASWTKAGLAVSALTKDASGAVGSDCVSGTVSGVDIVLCTFASEQAAKAAEPAGLNWVGEASGAAIGHGSVALAIADRRNADPSGRTMNQIIKLFRGPPAKE